MKYRSRDDVLDKKWELSWNHDVSSLIILLEVGNPSWLGCWLLLPFANLLFVYWAISAWLLLHEQLHALHLLNYIMYWCGPHGWALILYFLMLSHLMSTYIILDHLLFPFLCTAWQTWWVRENWRCWWKGYKLEWASSLRSSCYFEINRYVWIHSNK